MKRYQIITHDISCGYDEKLDFRTYREAQEAAKRYKEEWEEVFIVALPEIKVLKIYDGIKANGRRPYSWERFPFLYRDRAHQENDGDRNGRISQQGAPKMQFRVNVPNRNILPFAIAYAPYIISWTEEWFGDRVFTVDAPDNVREEIAGLTKENIEIIAN